MSKEIKTPTRVSFLRFMDSLAKLDQSCPITAWATETEPTTQWNFDGCLGTNTPETLQPGSGSTSLILNAGFSGTLISIVAN